MCALASELNVNYKCIELFSRRMDNGINKPSSQCFTFMKVMIGNLFALSVQFDLIPTKQ